jgi:hypothetical protein
MMKKIFQLSVISLVLITLACTDMGEPEILLPQIEVEVSIIDYSTQTIGTTQSREFYIANLGAGDLSGEITLVQDSSVFTFQPEGTFILSEADTLFGELSFTPMSAAEYTAELLIASDDPDSPELTIQVTGTGTAELVPVIAFSSSQISFGTIASDTFAQQTFTIFNLGTDTLNITTLSTDLPEYQLDVNAPLTLIPADSQNVIVTFTPAVAGTFNAQMTIVSNSSSSPHQIIISGAAEDIVSYTTQIQPIWNASCTACHGSNGGLSLSSYAQLMSGSNSGATVIPNNAVGSLLVKRLRGTSGTQMPQGGTPLSETTISLVETWIDQGAQDN